MGAKSKISVVLSVVDKLRLQFSLGSPIAIIVGLTDKENGGYFHWVEGDDPNESTMKVAVSYRSNSFILIALASMINPWHI